MKQRHLSLILALLLSMKGIDVFAHDIEVANSDGVTIYYTWQNNNTELAVSYFGNSAGDYTNEYTGNVIIPESVTYDGKTYPVTSIGGGAFAYCSGLISVTIPNSVTSIGGGAFNCCSGLTSVTIPNSVTSIGSEAFYECNGLTSVTIGNSVTSIGSEAFYGCSGLTSITIPNSVTDIGRNALSGTGWYNNQSDGIMYLDNWLIGYKGNKPNGTFNIINGTKGIGGNAFKDCNGLTSVSIPNSVTSISSSAFYGCSGLTSVSIPESVTLIGSWAFCNCI